MGQLKIVTHTLACEAGPLYRMEQAAGALLVGSRNAASPSCIRWSPSSLPDPESLAVLSYKSDHQALQATRRAKQTQNYHWHYSLVLTKSQSKKQMTNIMLF